MLPPPPPARFAAASNLVFYDLLAVIFYRMNRSPLHHAAIVGDVAKAIAIHRRRPSCIRDDRDCAGNTAVHIAAAGNAWQFISWAASTRMGQDNNLDMLECTNNKGRTPLHSAAAQRQTAAVRSLVACGANLAARTPESFSALQLAMFAPHGGPRDAVILSPPSGTRTGGALDEVTNLVWWPSTLPYRVPECGESRGCGGCDNTR